MNQTPTRNEIVRSDEWRPGSRVLDGYTVIRELGKGGAGIVYLLERPLTGRAIRFAAKKLLIPQSGKKLDTEALLREIRMWIDLPEHPNLTACRFVRMIDGAPIIFAEYIDGGTLADWNRSPHPKDLLAMLDIAIQFARGLHAAHRYGLIHQDVKPSNVLMTTAGVAKLTDFGLSRLQGVRGTLPDDRIPDSARVSSGGMTPAYCSPEQAGGERVSRHTDIWSYGLSVLEMFWPDQHWPVGFLAPSLLDAYLGSHRSGRMRRGDRVPRMPDVLAEVLEGCFREAPRERWGSMADVSRRITAVYESIAGQAYPRPTPDLPPIRMARRGTPPRTSLLSAVRKDPGPFLRRACAMASREIGPEEQPSGPRERSWRSLALADYALFDRALQCYRMHPDLCAPEHLNEQLEIHLQMGLILNELNDLRGAIGILSAAVDLVAKQSDSSLDSECRMLLAKIHINCAAVHQHLGELTDSAREGHRALALVSTIDREQAGPSILEIIGAAQIALAIDAYQNRRYDDAAARYAEAIRVLEEALGHDPAPHIAQKLAIACLNRSNLARALHQLDESLIWIDRAIQLSESLLDHPAMSDVAHGVALQYMNRGITLQMLNRKTDALASYRKALDVRETVIREQGRVDTRNELSRIQSNMAILMAELDRPDACSELIRESVERLESLIFEEGRTELLQQYALTCFLAAEQLRRIVPGDRILSYYDRGLEIVEYLNVEHPSEQLRSIGATHRAARDAFLRSQCQPNSNVSSEP